MLIFNKIKKNLTFCEDYFVADLAATTWAAENSYKIAFLNGFQINSLREQKTCCTSGPIEYTVGCWGYILAWKHIFIFACNFSSKTSAFCWSQAIGIPRLETHLNWRSIFWSTRCYWICCCYVPSRRKGYGLNILSKCHRLVLFKSSLFVLFLEKKFLKLSNLTIWWA